MTFAVLIARFGLAAIFLGAGLEGEAVVVSAGLLAHQGLLPLPGVMVAAAAGSFVADQLYFLIGRHFREHPRVRRLTAKPAFARALAILARHPTGFVLAFRFLYGFRTISPLAIGTSGIAASRFVLLNAVAAVIWGILFSGIGYLFGHGITRLFGKLRSVEHLLLAIAGAVVLALLLAQLTRWLRTRSGARPADAP